MQESILLIGAGGHARACIDVIEQHKCFIVAGLIGLRKEVGSHILGYPVLGDDADLPILLNNYSRALVTMGQIKSPKFRIKYFDLLLNSRCVMPVVISPYAYVSPHASLGAGTIVMHGAIVNAGAVIGSNCIINSQSLIEHDVVIEDHCHISTAAVINGGVHIGLGTFIGSNTSIRQNLQIGSHCVIGMGQRIFTDCVDGSYVPLIKECV